MNRTYRRADMSQQQIPLPGPGAPGYSPTLSSARAYQHQPPHLPPPQQSQHSQSQHIHPSHPHPPPPPPPSAAAAASHYQQPSHHQDSHLHPPQHQLRPDHSDHSDHPQHAQSQPPQQSHHQPPVRRPLPPYPGYQSSRTGQHSLPPPHPQPQRSSRPEEVPPPPRPLTADHHVKIEEGAGCEFSLEVHQQPRRARMCGFGDKDRRPITPPPCVRLVIIDKSTGKEIDYNEIDHSMFVLSVDLWNEDGSQEVNLVRTSAGPSPISSGSTGYPYPPLPSPEPPAHSYRQPSLPPPTRDSSYGQPQSMAYTQDYQSQPSQQGYGHGPTTPSYSSSSSYGPPAQYFPQQGGYRSETNGPPLQSPSNASSYRPSYSQDQSSLTRMGIVGGSERVTGMFTRNLIGSLAASAFRLCDTEDRVGIWFVLQDMSVRTEGSFRLKFSFVNVGRGLSMEGRSSTLNQGRAPILSSCFSESFSVFSAKKFPGVCESTPLSKTFAAQGIKIPIRKDANMKGGDGADDDYD